MDSKLTKKKDYRKDIDGLRAIAVLLVVFYHLGGTLFPAGFIGVDIFFVISGFLITSHIYRDIEKKQFSLKQFYLRRMRRILPALIVVLFFTSLAAYFLLFRYDLINYGKSQLSVLFSVSNFYFWKFIHVGYFSTDSRVLPLLHTWSLGVEEQFYIVWPLLLLGLSKIFSKHQLCLAVIFLALCSFLTFFFYREHSQFVFYSPITRAFELLLGALLALNENALKPFKNQLTNHTLSIIGLIAIFFSACVVKSAHHPELNALLPTLGTALLIYTGKGKTIGNKVLGLQPFVFVGLISYSLYLWHWPLIAYLNYFEIPITYTSALFILILSIALSFTTWKLVEQPFRYRFKFDFKKTFLLFLVIPILLAYTFYKFSRQMRLFAFNQISQSAYHAIKNQYFGPINPKSACHNIHPKQNPSRLLIKKVCFLGNLNARNTQVLITGDSHAMSEIGMIDVFLKKSGLKGYIATQCGTDFLLFTPEVTRQTKKRNILVMNLISRSHYKYVVMGGIWESALSSVGEKKFKIGLENAITFIFSQKSRPVIFLDYAPLLHVKINCGLTRISRKKCFNHYRDIQKIQQKSMLIIFSLKEKYPQLILVEPNKIICRDKKCYSSMNSLPLYFTGKMNSHLNYAGSTLIGKLYLKKYGNPFNRDYWYSHHI